ncbi:MAG: hypothetical protein D6798_10955 [Deltaproteobacteria bacterium]|nr:MAG: hypothetical protein D6798_10955 [Deltaproteobacteria bacterium]
MRGLLLAVLLALAPAPASAAIVDRVAAVVNDEVITLSEVYDFAGDYIEQRAAAGPESRRAAELEVLDSLIQRALIRQEIVELGIDVTDLDVDRAIDDIARRNGMDRDQLRDAVQAQGMSWTQYRDEIKEGLRQQQFTGYIMQTRITVDEDELRDLYNRWLADHPPAEVLDLGAYLVPLPPDADPATVEAAIARAEAGRQRVAAGEDFVAVARELDSGAFAAHDARIGVLKDSELRPELAEPVRATPKGSTTPPIVTDAGVMVVYVFDRRQEPPPSFEDMRDELEQQLYQDLIDDEIEQWVQQARRQAAVEVKLPPPQ